MSRDNESSKYILKNERRGIATPVTNVHEVLTMWQHNDKPFIIVGSFYT